jgi:hypothetical protein
MTHPAHTSPDISALPPSFRPLFWSYRFDDLDPDKDKKTIIVQLLNYGTLAHWAWLIEQYGRRDIANVLEHLPASEIRLRTRLLASLFFPITSWRYAPRGPHQ